MSSTLFFAHEGNRLAYTRTGSGHPILFLHNGGAAKEIWIRQATALADRYEVICLDHLGFGESDMPETGYTIGEYVERLSAFIDHLAVDRISIVANCMGSAMTLLLAERRPELFRALVLINPLSENTARRGVIGLAIPFATRLPRFSRWFARQASVPKPLTRFVIAAQYGPRGWRRGILAPLPGAVDAGGGWNVRGRLVSMVELFTDVAALGAVDRLRPGREFPPLAVVWGNANLGLSPRAGRVLNETLRPDRAEFLPGCGHLPMMEVPDAVTAIIVEFVTNPPVRLADTTVSA
ncbi:alpha/beta fold hydrolase [Nocardia sp. NPDC058058]|uniref:alpha/beta fold hydrolase n=1 Tax=Nocardia sp. NPDC058058 TaxID=3346317 RepID=UPI0036DA33A7